LRRHDPPEAIAHRRHGQRDVDQAPVSCDPLGLEVLDALAATEPRKHLLFFCAPIRRDDKRDVLADCR
jgi:hypothetical protein